MNLIENIRVALSKGCIVSSAAQNLEKWICSDLPEWSKESIRELVAMEAWDELNDRFFKDITFGTGGMRGRVLGNIRTKSEVEINQGNYYPRFAMVGTNAMNDANVIRATIGLYRYIKSMQPNRVLKLIVAYDVRYFSKHFCELTASTWIELGGEALIFDGPRSTPQLSFSVRRFSASAGVMITASHNPFYDNGFKVYLGDGGQIVFPHDESIISEVNKVALEEALPFFEKKTEHVVFLEKSADDYYLGAVKESVIHEAGIRKMKSRMVFSPIHGTGGISALPLLKSYGIDVVEVVEQSDFSPDFRTVKNPNPEYAESLQLGIDYAKRFGANVVVGTDADGDRIGVAVRDKNGNFRSLSGNEIAIALAEYRIRMLKDIGIIPPEGTRNAAIIKSFVTTPLLGLMAKKHGLKLVNTLTGFKWIAKKLSDYETELQKNLKKGDAISEHGCTNRDDWRQLYLQHGTYAILGAEESHGVLASSFVRDKDANAATLMICELLGYLENKNQSVIDFLDEIYSLYGHCSETFLSIYYEGASGSDKIKKIISRFRKNPPKRLGNMNVLKIADFKTEILFDEDGKELPKEDFFRITLENHYLCYLRPSGTESKIKIYIYGYHDSAPVSKAENVKEDMRQKTDNIAGIIKNEIEQCAII